MEANRESIYCRKVVKLTDMGIYMNKEQPYTQRISKNEYPALLFLHRRTPQRAVGTRKAYEKIATAANVTTKKAYENITKIMIKFKLVMHGRGCLEYMHK